MRTNGTSLMIAVFCLTITLLSTTPVHAASTSIGVYQNGIWYLDANQSWDWNGTPTDILGIFGVGLSGAIPVVGDWNGDGKSEIGVYIDGIWYLDMNGNWQWDEGLDVMGVFGVGVPNAVPVTGDWNGDGITEIGIYSNGYWYLDTNRSWDWNGPLIDTFGIFGVGVPNAVPVTGDWNGDGITEIGIYSNGYWYLDTNRSWDWNDTPTDTFGIFGVGVPNAVPVTGDWNGDGITKIGVYSEGNWYLDTNASWQWDGTPTDTFGIFGVGLGNVIPVTGNWGSTLSKFTGTWTGTWQDTLGLQGTLTITVLADGTFTGTVVNVTLNLTGSTSGSFAQDGSVTGQFAYPGETYQFLGAVGIGGNGHLIGAIDEYQGTTLIGVATFDLIKQ